mmetsp:Transcript_24025/g.42677  ORF Transcript_24025/g.42677 Transcript_24025/m.42677 type:complete len:128 (-) Transcript_24025:1655-2038(-)
MRVDALEDDLDTANERIRELEEANSNLQTRLTELEQENAELETMRREVISKLSSSKLSKSFELIDKGKQFLEQVKERLPSEDFTKFLRVFKLYKEGQLAREAAFAQVNALFGTHHKDLYETFAGLIR